MNEILGSKKNLELTVGELESLDTAISMLITTTKCYRIKMKGEKELYDEYTKELNEYYAIRDKLREAIG